MSQRTLSLSLLFAFTALNCGCGILGGTRTSCGYSRAYALARADSVETAQCSSIAPVAGPSPTPSPAGETVLVPYDVAEDGTGNLFVLGHDSGRGPILRRSPDGGQTWGDARGDLSQGSRYTRVLGIGAGPGGALYATGAFPAAGGETAQQLMVLRSIDLGDTWTSVDSFLPSESTASRGMGVSGDSSGNLFVFGSYVASSGPSHWVVRRSVNAASSWSTVEDFNSGGLNAEPVGIAFDAEGTLLVVGVSGGTRWLVRKSTDHGASWMTVDDFNYLDASASIPTGIVVAPAGKVCVSGYLTKTVEYWLVRCSADGGATWSTSDLYSGPRGGQAARAHSIARAPNGDLYVAGAYGLFGTPGVSGTRSLAWTVRRSSDSGATWTTVDDMWFPYPFVVFVSSGGHVFAAGTGEYTNGPMWYLRKSADEGKTWTVSDRFFH